MATLLGFMVWFNIYTTLEVYMIAHPPTRVLKGSALCVLLMSSTAAERATLVMTIRDMVSSFSRILPPPHHSC